MDINSMFLNNMKFSFNNLKNNIQTNNSSNSLSFSNQYENYKNQYENKNVDNKNTIDEKTEVKTNKPKVLNSKKIKEQSKEDKTSNSKALKSKEDVSNRFIEELASKLDISVEEVSLILEKLNIDVFGLIDTNNLNNFVQTSLNIENPVDLIISSDAKQLYKDLMQIIHTYKSDIDSITNVIDNELLLDTLKATDGEVSEEIVAHEFEVKSTQNLDEKIDTLNINTSLNNESLEDTQSLDENESMPTIEIKTKNDNSKNEFTNNEQKEDKAPLNNPIVQNYDYTNINSYSSQNFNLQPQIMNESIVNTTDITATKNVNQIVNQIVEKIKVDLKPDVSEIKLILKPESLGELSLKITTENNIITAQFIAESQQVKEILQANFNHLKDTLQQLGLIVDELSVSVGQQNSEAKQHFEQNQEKSKRRIQQILDNINNLEGTDIIFDKDYVNPYEISDNEVDYIA